MSWNRDEYTDDEWELVNIGKLCPNSECKSESTMCVGYAPDGVNVNAAFDCIACGQEWEGH